MVKPIMKKALNGFNGSIFMYGQTTSGKTFTMLGTQNSPGVLPCTIRDIFQLVDLVSKFKFNLAATIDLAGALQHLGVLSRDL
jgi:centromeric protein E